MKPFLLALLLTLVPSLAHADDYRGEAFASDGLAVGAIAAGAAVPPVMLGGFGLYLGGVPYLHWRHHHPGRAVASVVLRVGGLVGGAELGAASVKSDDGEERIGGAIVGGVLGMLVAALFDDLGATDDVTPYAAPTRGGATAGIVASF